MRENLDIYAGRSAVYIESGYMCAATVKSVRLTEKSFQAAFQAVPNAFCCRLRIVRMGSEDLIDDVLQEPPFGEAWNVSASKDEFYLDEDHWQVTFLFGGGIRVFFQPEYVARFLSGDVSSIDEYYDDGEDECNAKGDN